jgi:hypothetical protein
MTAFFCVTTLVVLGVDSSIQYPSSGEQTKAASPLKTFVLASKLHGITITHYCSGNALRLAFGKCAAPILLGKPTTQTDDSSQLSNTLQTMSGYYSQFTPRFPSSTFIPIYLLMTPFFDTVFSELVTELLNKLQDKKRY